MDTPPPTTNQTLPRLVLGSWYINNNEGNKANGAAGCAIITSQIETRVMQVSERGKLKLGLKEILGVTTKTWIMRRST